MMTKRENKDFTHYVKNKCWVYDVKKAIVDDRLKKSTVFELLINHAEKDVLEKILTFSRL